MRNMKKIFLLISAILLIVPVQAQHTLRLMTYNIKMQQVWMVSVTSSVLQM